MVEHIEKAKNIIRIFKDIGALVQECRVRSILAHDDFMKNVMDDISMDIVDAVTEIQLAIENNEKGEIK